MRGLHKPLERIQRERSDALRERVMPQIQAALRALANRGVSARLFGSFAKENALVGPDSDIDLLIEDDAGIGQRQLLAIVRQHIPRTKVDLLVERDLPAAVVEIKVQC